MRIASHRIGLLLLCLLLLPSLAFAQSTEVSTANSTTTNLVNAAVFTGTSEDLTRFKGVTVFVYASHASAASGLSLEFSSNGTNWDLTYTSSVSATTALVRTLPTVGRYFRVVYTNGAVTTTTLRLQTMFHSTYVPIPTATGNAVVDAVQSGTWTVQPGNTANTTAWLQKLSQATTDNDVDLASALPAGTNNIGDVDVLTLPSVTIGTFPDNEPFNVAQINGVAPTMGNGISGTGVQRVTLASDSTGQVALAAGAATIGSLASNQSVNVAQVNGVATTTGNGVSGTGVQRVTLASDSTGQVALAAGSATIGALTANQSTNTAQINGVAPTMGNGISGTGVQRVTLASDSTGQVTLAAGAATIGALTANQSVNAAQINGVAPLMGNGITGTGSQRVTVASDNTAFAVNATLQTGANTIGALTANQSVNVAQVAGTATSTGVGATGAGVQRVVLATNDPCGSSGIAKSSVVLNVTASAQVIAASGSTIVYVCGFSASIAGTTPTFQFQYGTGAVCATGLTNLSGVYAPLTGTYAAYGGGEATVFATTGSQALCVATTGASPSLQGVLTYIQQ